jgi:hypothetical protein
MSFEFAASPWRLAVSCPRCSQPATISALAASAVTSAVVLIRFMVMLLSTNPFSIRAGAVSSRLPLATVRKSRAPISSAA